MENKRVGKRIVRPATAEESKRYRAILKQEKAGIEANKALGRTVLAERRELGAIVAELKSIREQLQVTLTELAERTGMTVSNLSRLENMEGPNPTIETLRRYAHAIGHRPSAIGSSARWWQRNNDRFRTNADRADVRGLVVYRVRRSQLCHFGPVTFAPKSISSLAMSS